MSETTNKTNPNSAGSDPERGSAPFPGIPTATDGSGAVVHAETLASEAAGAYPITPSTQMGEGWALAVAAGQTNIFGSRLCCGRRLDDRFRLLRFDGWRFCDRLFATATSGEAKS